MILIVEKKIIQTYTGGRDFFFSSLSFETLRNIQVVYFRIFSKAIFGDINRDVHLIALSGVWVKYQILQDSLSPMVRAHWQRLKGPVVET